MEIYGVFGGLFSEMKVTLGADEQVELRYTNRELTFVARGPMSGPTASQLLDAELARAVAGVEDKVDMVSGDTGSAQLTESFTPSEAASGGEPRDHVSEGASGGEPRDHVSGEASGGEPRDHVSEETAPGPDPNLSTVVFDGVGAEAVVKLDSTGIPYEEGSWALAGLPPGTYALSFVIDGKEQLFPVTLAAGRTTRCSWEGGGLRCAFE